MMMHRPLSAWVVAVELSADGTARWSPSADVNYGDERADARALPEFSDGWRRQAVPLDEGYLVLALVRDGAGEAVVEVDNRARPVRVSAAAAVMISFLEDAWPYAALSEDDLAILAREDTMVRYLVADRLEDEGDPPPELFHVLPWGLVERLAGQVAETLDGAPPPPEIIELGHWFNPVGSRFTAALEQLDEGLRSQEPALARVAATALCSRLLAVPAARLPEPTRAALARLAGRLDRVDPFLRFSARRAAARLAPGGETGDVRALRLDAQLAAAADDESGVRTESLDAPREPFTVRLVVTATRRAEVTVSAPLSPELQVQVDTSYGVILVPVRVTADAGSTRYVMPLGFSGGRLYGQLDLPVPAGQFIEADADGPPIGVPEAALLSSDEVRRSIRALGTVSGRAVWDRVAELLPEGHPLRTLIGEETE
jgi:hypothetical protein